LAVVVLGVYFQLPIGETVHPGATVSQTCPTCLAIRSLGGLDQRLDLARRQVLSFPVVGVRLAQRCDWAGKPGKTNIYFARQQINERLVEAHGSLPPGAEPRIGPISTGRTNRTPAIRCAT
jgi:hypothetical protein